MTEPAILIVEDDANLREALHETLEAASRRVLTAANGPAALKILSDETVGLVVSDLQMEPMDGATLLRTVRHDYPALPTVLMTAYGTIENAVGVMREGASDYLVKPFPATDLLSVVDKYLRPDATTGSPVAADPASCALLRVAKRVAASDATVTICGESGAGKEVVARFIHEHSARSAQPFVAINCAAIPENMLEAVLFGHEKGAFTGASSAHAGKFEQADGGTLLLDEISEMDLGLQAKILRVIQEKEVERIGARKTIPLDVRVLATTNRDLREQVAAGRFREDLFYRLNVFPLQVPPLRERKGDILPLAELFVRQARQQPITLSDDAREALLSYDWPGNVRELDNVIQRSLILLTGSEVSANDLAFEIAENAHCTVANDLHQGVEDHEFQLIVDALIANSGHRSNTANALGISSRTLRYKLARMRERGITIPGESHG